MPSFTRHYPHWPAGVPHTMPVPGKHLFSLLEDSARQFPTQTALYYYGRRISYRELHKASLNLAGYLQQRIMIKRGDRVMLLMQNCPQFVIAYYAILRCDAVVVAISPMSSTQEIDHYRADAGARTLLTTQELLGSALPLLDDGRLEAGMVGVANEMAGEPERVPFLEFPDFVLAPRRGYSHRRLHDFGFAVSLGLSPLPMQGKGDDLAVLGYTSGTTGQPKGAMLSHDNLLLASVQRAAWLPERAHPTVLGVLPINHLAGMGLMNQAILKAGTLAMLSRWDCAAALELIERLGISSLAVITPMVAEMFARPDIDQRDLSSVERIYGGATAMPEALAAEIERRLGVAFIEGYGMTESSGSTHINPPNAPRRQCGGIPSINVDSRIIDPESGGELGPNQTGEIVTHSPIVFRGYWNQPEATNKAFITLDGKQFLRTGDIGYYDEDGYFYITDRLKRMINASGFKVWPAEIESMLYAHPAVQEACVIGACDPKRGETVKAFVILRPTAKGQVLENQLTEWARERMANYKVPRLVEFVDSLPKNAAGKTLWRELQREQDERDRAARVAMH
ncbi:AMP-binding protein [Pseudomonas sp. NPDC089996]|uniref:AMP-binding protein n=1 Tax=Pseudomonas sp. NPDC089996 TaxID=3364474 RepID=UPI003820D4E5